MIFDLTLTDNLDLGTKEKALPQGMHISNYERESKEKEKARHQELLTKFSRQRPSPSSSVGSVQDLGRGGRWFDLRLGNIF